MSAKKILQKKIFFVFMILALALPLKME